MPKIGYRRRLKLNKKRRMAKKTLSEVVEETTNQANRSTEIAGVEERSL